MSIYFLESENYTIKTLEVSEVTQDYVNWLNDPEVNEFLEVKYTSWTIENCRTFVAGFEGSTSEYIFGIYSNNSDTHIGNGSVSAVNVNTGTFTISLFIGEKKYWGSSAGTEVILLLLKFGFDHLGLRKCFCGAYSTQLASRFILRKLCAIEEAKLRDKFFHKGIPVDEVIYGIDRNIWMKIKLKYDILD